MQIFNGIASGASNAIGDSSNNHVGYAVDQMNKDYDISNQLGKTIAGGFSGLGKAKEEGVFGTYFRNSPVYLASQLSQLGQFFTHATPGNFYTNKYDDPHPSKPPQSADPIEFNNRFYQRMREFAQGEEIASAGQPRIRGGK